MRRAMMLSYVSSAVIGLYAIAALCANLSAYASYIGAYGIMQVFITVASTFFTIAPWSVLFLIIGLCLDTLSRKNCFFSESSDDEDDKNGEVNNDIMEEDEEASEEAEQGL